MKSSPNSTASARNTNASHPPLARNAQGHPIALPDGTAFWQIKRETRGRPQVIKGPDGRPYRLPLTATDQDVADTFGPGPYRFDALDALGNVLDYVATIEITGDESDGDARDEDRGSSSSRARGTVSDLRFALEALTQMARANADSIRAVAEAQADWVKGLASAKALPRNAGYALPPGLPNPSDDNDDDDDDEDDDDDDPDEVTEPAPPPQPAWVAVTQVVAAQAAETIARNAGPAIEAWVSKLMGRNGTAPTTETAPSQTTVPTPEPASAPTSVPAQRNPMVHLSEINAGLADDERSFLAHVLRTREADVLTAELLGRTVDDAIEFVRGIIAQVLAKNPRVRAHDEDADPDDDAPRRDAPDDGATATAPAPQPSASDATARAPDFLSHVLAVSALLDANQRASVRALLPRLAPERMEQLKGQLLAMEPAAAAAWVRDNLADLCAEVES